MSKNDVFPGFAPFLEGSFQAIFIENIVLHKTYAVGNFSPMYNMGEFLCVFFDFFFVLN